MIVPATIVNDILDGKKPETFENSKNIKNRYSYGMACVGI